VELVKLSHRGTLYRVGHGVYRIKHHVPTALDKYAEAVALVGSGAYLYGESVLAIHGLAQVNPAVIYVASPKRVRKNLPAYIKTVPVNCNSIMHYEGIPTQSLADAFHVCKSTVMQERLKKAVKEAVNNGFLSDKEAKQVRKELRT
jgi:predicted transcriptional regulator of viral defense system